VNLHYIIGLDKIGKTAEVLVNKTLIKKFKNEYGPFFDKESGKWCMPPINYGEGIDYDKMKYFVELKDLDATGSPKKIFSRFRGEPPTIEFKAMGWIMKFRWWFELKSSENYTKVPLDFYDPSILEARETAFNAFFELPNKPRLLVLKTAVTDWELTHSNFTGHCVDLNEYWKLLKEPLPVDTLVLVQPGFRGIPKWYFSQINAKFHKQIDVVVDAVYGKRFDQGTITDSSALSDGIPLFSVQKNPKTKGAYDIAERIPLTSFTLGFKYYISEVCCSIADNDLADKPYPTEDPFEGRYEMFRHGVHSLCRSIAKMQPRKRKSKVDYDVKQKFIKANNHCFLNYIDNQVREDLRSLTTKEETLSMVCKHLEALEINDPDDDCCQNIKSGNMFDFDDEPDEWKDMYTYLLRDELSTFYGRLIITVPERIQYHNNLRFLLEHRAQFPVPTRETTPAWGARVLCVDFWHGKSTPFCEHYVCLFLIMFISCCIVNSTTLGNQSHLTELKDWFDVMSVEWRAEHDGNQLGSSCGLVAMNVLWRIRSSTEDLYSVPDLRDATDETVLIQGNKALFPSEPHQGADEAQYQANEAIYKDSGIEYDQEQLCTLGTAFNGTEVARFEAKSTSNQDFYVHVTSLDQMLAEVVRVMEDVTITNDTFHFCVNNGTSMEPGKHWYSLVLEVSRNA